MTSKIVSPAQANLELALWQVDADSMTSSEIYTWLINSGLPNDVTLRLQELADFTKKANGKVFNIGKIIVIKIIEFVQAHPYLVAGASIGAAVGAVIYNFAVSVPFLGVVLAPVAAALGITITVVGAIAGHRLDKRVKGENVADGVMGIAENIIEVVKEFFQFIVDVFSIIFRNVVTA